MWFTQHLATMEMKPRIDRRARATKPRYATDDTMRDKLVARAAIKFGYGLVTGVPFTLVIKLILLVPTLVRNSNCSGSFVSSKLLQWESNASAPPIGPTKATLQSVKAKPTIVAEIRDVMQSNQQLYCNNEVPELPRGIGVQVLQPHGVTLYGPVDNYNLKYLQKTARLESHMMHEMVWAIGQYRASTTAEPKKPLVLDIGADIGWVTANAVKAGARVAAFEARTSMLWGLHKTLCSSPWMMESVVLYPMDLGLDTGDCIYISSDGYDSDSRKVCLNESEPYPGLPIGAMRVTRWPQDTSRYLVVSSLDKLFDEHIQVMKVDVHSDEGSRPLVLQGAEALLRKGLVPYIILRVDEPMLQFAGKGHVLDFLQAHNYACSYFGFQGRAIQDMDDYLNGKGRLPSDNLYDNVYCYLKRAAETVKDFAPVSVRSRKLT